MTKFVLAQQKERWRAWGKIAFLGWPRSKLPSDQVMFTFQFRSKVNVNYINEVKILSLLIKQAR
jgi:hypothetical protein